MKFIAYTHRVSDRFQHVVRVTFTLKSKKVSLDGYDNRSCDTTQVRRSSLNGARHFFRTGNRKIFRRILKRDRMELKFAPFAACKFLMTANTGKVETRSKM